MLGGITMKVFLLIHSGPYDADIVYGIYSSIENAKIAQSNPDVSRFAEIKELELDATHTLGV